MSSTSKHPKGLMVLFYTEMWERFSYYGMRALLVLYLTTELAKGGFGLQRDEALRIYATFTGLVYLMPILGGYLADKFLGQRKAVYIGAILMAIGQLFMAYSEFGDIVIREYCRNIGLGLIISGTGFFKANISTIVGSLYTENDPRKDSAFTIFYLGINIGALLGPFIAGYLGQQIDWFWGFTSVGLGMILSMIWFYSKRDLLGPAGMPPGRESVHGKYHLTRGDRFDILFYVSGSIIIILGIILLWSSISVGSQHTIIWTFFIVGFLLLAYIITKNTRGRNAWRKMSVIFILAFFNVFFWAGYEQAGGTFNLFAEHQTNRLTIFGEFPASWFQSLPALYIVLFASLFAIIWLKLNAKGKEPRTTVKFGLGLLLMSIGFIIMNKAALSASDGELVSPLWLISVFFMHTMGELCLSPIGISMVTKLAPQKISSIMMGVWFASFAVANYLAGVLEKILHSYFPETHLFLFLTYTSLAAGIVLLILSPVINKLMKEVH